MSWICINISYLCFINLFVHIQTLDEIPILEDCDLKTTEAAVRQTVSSLLVALRIQDAANRPRLKKISTVHNFFVSITLADCKNIEEIKKLTRGNDIDNSTKHFITNLNEVLDDDNKNSDAYENNIFITEYSNTFITKLKDLKEKYLPDKRNQANEEILEYLDHYARPLIGNNKITNDTNDDHIDDDAFWKPSKTGKIENTRRIYGSSTTSIKKFPFLASVQFFKKFQCAGSIIKSDLVLTSASCLQIAWNNRFFRENPAFLSIQVGSDFYLPLGGENIPILEIYFHPGYEPKTLKNNLVLLRLTRAVSFRKKNTKRIKKINFDKEASPLAVNAGEIVIVGWGARDRTNNLDHQKNKLSYAELNFYSLQECQEHYTKEFVTNTNFCAGFLTKGSGACSRDAGDPGIVDGILMGVTSFGSPVCGAPDSPTVFTKVGYYADWIEKIMEMEVVREKVSTTKEPFTKENFVTKPKKKTPKKVQPVTEQQSFQDFVETVFEDDGKNVLKMRPEEKKKTDEHFTNIRDDDTKIKVPHVSSDLILSFTKGINSMDSSIEEKNIHDTQENESNLKNGDKNAKKMTNEVESFITNLSLDEILDQESTSSELIESHKSSHLQEVNEEKDNIDQITTKPFHNSHHKISESKIARQENTQVTVNHKKSYTRKNEKVKKHESTTTTALFDEENSIEYKTINQDDALKQAFELEKEIDEFLYKHFNNDSNEGESKGNSDNEKYFNDTLEENYNTDQEKNAELDDTVEIYNSINKNKNNTAITSMGNLNDKNSKSLEIETQSILQPKPDNDISQKYTTSEVKKHVSHSSHNTMKPIKIVRQENIPATINHKKKHSSKKHKTTTTSVLFKEINAKGFKNSFEDEALKQATDLQKDIEEMFYINFSNYSNYEKTKDIIDIKQENKLENINVKDNSVKEYKQNIATPHHQNVSDIRNCGKSELVKSIESITEGGTDIDDSADMSVAAQTVKPLNTREGANVADQVVELLLTDNVLYNDVMEKLNHRSYPRKPKKGFFWRK